INLHQQSLAIDREIGNRGGEANSLNNLGIAYFPLGEYQRSINLHQQSLAIDREIGNREGAGRTLNNIGTLFDFQEQPELAIVFYKESVNVREGIRGDISSLTRQLQESYASTIAGTYRRLADLLLSQGRILEAQQVLELLKIQEIRDYIRSRNAGGNVEDLIFLVEELEIRDQHGQLIVFDQKLAACKQTRCPDLSQLRQQRDDLKREYNQAIRVLEESISQRQAQGEIIDPNNLPKNARDILNTQPGTMLIYPFVTDDKLWLLLATQGGLPSVRQIPVSQGELSAKVLKLRELLQDAQSGTAEIQEISQQLYRWLITPLEEELTTGEIKHLVFALDRAVRYIPMGVLFDGNNYLIEKYTVTTIISAELTDTRERLPSSVEETSVLAMGLSEASEGFNPLPHVETEIDAIVREEDEQPDALGIYPGSKFINSNFNWDNLTNNLEDRQILHIATHGNFSPVSQENSFLLLGDRKLPVSEIQLLDEYLEDVHLVVLSACQTALADNSLQIGDGNEINSISFHFLNAGIKGGAGPKALLASLWNVNDEKTSQLMESFYQNLAAESGIAKAKALQQAQLSFLTDSERSHPYYWAPFILIGNGL
ncbi:MAG: CHAT domain-containing protein, partial [Cyanobacteria bacterium J06558_2]